MVVPVTDNNTSAPALPQRTPYQASSHTRREIVERAAEAFGTQGFQGASLRGIAKAAGINHSTLIHHFGNKATLLVEVLKWRDRNAAPANLDLNMTTDSLISALVEVARLNQQMPGITQLFSVMLAEAGDPGHPAREYLQLRHRGHLSMFSQIVEGRRAAGSLAPNGLSPEQEAARIVATWEGLEVFDRLHPGLIDLPTALEVTLRTSFGLAEGEVDQTPLTLSIDLIDQWMEGA